MAAKVPAAGVDLDGAVTVNESSGSVDFRIESNGEASMFFVDGSADAIAINTTTVNSNYVTTIQANSDSGALSLDGATTNGYYAMEIDMPNGSTYGALFKNNGSTVGTIRINASDTAYNTSSDYRLKENVDYTWDATTKLKQLKPARFNWIADDTNALLEGFLAHEVSSIVPQAVAGDKDGVDKDGNPEYQGIDQSKLVPLMVKTIQELEARIKTLEDA